MCSTIYENLEKRFSCLKDWILYITFMKTYAKAFDCVDHNKLWEILKEMGIPDHLTCLLRNLYPGQKARVRTGHGTIEWFQIEKGEHQGYILSLCLFNLYAEYMMRNTGLDEAQAGIKIARKNINNLRYADDTTHLVKAMVFPVVMYGCESWTIRKAEHWRLDAFELWCWRRLLRVPWPARRSNQSILKEISPEVHWKDWCWSWNSNTLATWWEELTHLKRPWCWERLRAGGEGDNRDRNGGLQSMRSQRISHDWASNFLIKLG